MHFATKLSPFGSECRAGPHVKEAGTGNGIGRIADERTDDVDAVAWKENVRVDREIRRRVSECSADLVTERYVADEDGRPPEKRGGACDVAAGEE